MMLIFQTLVGRRMIVRTKVWRAEMAVSTAVARAWTNRVEATFMRSALCLARCAHGITWQRTLGQTDGRVRDRRVAPLASGRRRPWIARVVEPLIRLARNFAAIAERRCCPPAPRAAHR